MQECDAAIVGAGTGRPVDQGEPGSFEPAQGGVEIGDAVRDVVEAGAAAGEEAADGRVGSERFQQLEPATELPQGWTFGVERIALRDTHVRPGDVGTGDGAPLDVTVRDARVSIGRRRATAFGRAPNLYVDAVVDGGRILVVGSSDPRDDGVMIDAMIHVKDAPLARFGAYRPAVLGSSIAGEVSGRLHYQRDPGRRDRIVGRLRGRHIAVQSPTLAQPALAIRRVEIGVDVSGSDRAIASGSGRMIASGATGSSTSVGSGF